MNTVTSGTPFFYAPWHPLKPKPPTVLNTLHCFLHSHDLTVTNIEFPDVTLLCLNCSLYLSVQYLAASRPPVTLPEQQRAKQH